jgi:hypothetical protein
MAEAFVPGLTFADLARVTTATTGYGTITLGAAVLGFLTFSDAGITPGKIVPYAISDGSNSETGWGVVTNSAGTWTLTRNVMASTNGGSAINLSGSAQVMVAPTAFSVPQAPVLLNTVTLSGAGGAYLSDTTSIASYPFSSYTIRLLNIIPATNSVDILVQFYANGAWQTANYMTNGTTTGNAGTGVSTSFSAAAILLNYPARVATTGTWQGLNARMELYQPALGNAMLTGESAHYSAYDAGIIGTNFQGALVYNYPITGIRAFAAATNTTSSGYNITGTMKIYGNP